MLTRLNSDNSFVSCIANLNGSQSHDENRRMARNETGRKTDQSAMRRKILSAGDALKG